MRWFKMFGEARNDAKLRVLTDEQFRTWFNLLCLASEQDEVGVIEGYDEMLLAVEVCNGDVTLLNVTLEKLVTLRVVTRSENHQITFLKFTKRQADTKSSSRPAVAERVRKHREKAKKGQKPTENLPETANVTECNADVTGCNALQGECNGLDKRRGEEKRREQSTSPTARPRPATEIPNRPDIESPLAMAVREICNLPSMLAGKNRESLERILPGLIAEGATPEQVREFGRKCIGHWCGRDDHNRARAPAIINVLNQWRHVLALPEPGEAKTSSVPSAAQRRAIAEKYKNQSREQP